MPLELKEPVGDVARMSVTQANRVRAEIDRMMVKSINHADRYEAGTVSFAETQLVAHSVANLISTEGHPDDHPLEMIKGLNSKIRSKIVSRAPQPSRSDLLFMSPSEQRDRFNLSADEVRHLRRAIVGLEGPAPDPQNRWDRPGRSGTERSKIKVPLLKGLQSNDAEAALAAAGLIFVSGTIVDSPLPSGTVVLQEPAAGATVEPATEVAVRLACGLSVRLPEIIGARLSEATCRLRDAGLISEPTVEGRPVPDAHVVALEPHAGTLVTPNTPVTIGLRRRADARHPDNT